MPIACIGLIPIPCILFYVHVADKIEIVDGNPFEWDAPVSGYAPVVLHLPLLFGTKYRLVLKSFWHCTNIYFCLGRFVGVPRFSK